MGSVKFIKKAIPRKALQCRLSRRTGRRFLYVVRILALHVEATLVQVPSTHRLTGRRVILSVSPQSHAELAQQRPVDIHVGDFQSLDRVFTAQEQGDLVADTVGRG